MTSFFFGGRSVERYLFGFSSFYPRISEWCRQISQTALTGRRRAIVATANERVLGVVLLKLGEDVKLCHVSVSPDARGLGVGLELMRWAAHEVAQYKAARVHVTTGEEVTDTHWRFFSRCGFSLTEEQRGRYRRGVSEYLWRTSSAELVARLSSSDESIEHGWRLESSIGWRSTLGSCQLRSTKAYWDNGLKFKRYGAPASEHQESLRLARRS